MITPKQLMKTVRACRSARRWVNEQGDMSMYQMWRSCPRGAWLDYVIDELEYRLAPDGYKTKFWGRLLRHRSEDRDWELRDKAENLRWAQDIRREFTWSEVKELVNGK